MTSLIHAESMASTALSRDKSVFYFEFCNPSLVTKSLWAPIALLGVLVAPSQGSAATLGYPVYVEGTTVAQTCTVGACTLPVPVEGVNASKQSTNSFASNTLSLSKAPNMTSFATAALSAGSTNGPGVFTRAGSVERLQYYFQISGPSNVPVPVQIKASGEVKTTVGSYTGSNGAGAFATLGIVGEGFSLVRDIKSTYGEGDTGGTTSDSFAIDGTYDLSIDTLYQVSMRISTVITLGTDQGASSGGLTSFASLDPSFDIDPAYLGRYSIAFSEGLVGTVSPVPLPGALPLFGAAALATAAFGRVLRRQVGVRTA